LNKLRHTQLLAFAHAVEDTLHRGRTYTAGVAEGIDPLLMIREMHRPLSWLKRAAETAEAYGETSFDELACSAILAAARGAVKAKTFSVGLGPPGRMLRTLGPSGRFARSVLEWRRLEESEELPPVEFVAHFLGELWGEVIFVREWPEMGEYLASGFPGGELPVSVATELLDKYSGQILTPELALEIARKATDVARARRDEGLPRVEASFAWVCAEFIRWWGEDSWSPMGTLDVPSGGSSSSRPDPEDGTTAPAAVPLPASQVAPKRDGIPN
jgi:hypothetical protein